LSSSCKQFIIKKCTLIAEKGQIMGLEQIRQGLQDRRLTVVAQATGLHYNTVRAISTGENTNPTHETMQRLADYLEGRENGRSN
jgi:hypothetical protein